MRKRRGGVDSVLDGDEVSAVLRDTFYTPNGRKRTRKKAKAAKPDHYEVICISLYREDLSRLDGMVAKLKKAGHRKMSRSALIRFALDHVDLKQLPKAY